MTEAARRGVLITRPQEDAARTASRIESLGYVPVAAPFLDVRSCAATMPGRVQAILVTSGNALASLPVRDVPLFAVGDATAARARDAGFAIVHSAGRDAGALVELVRERARPVDGPLLLVCGSGQGFAAATALREAGFSVIRRVTYRAMPVRAFPAEAAKALRNQMLHAALFLSAETAASFVRTLPGGLAGDIENVMALAIGKQAADRLNHLPWRQLRVARAPTLDDVLTLL